MIFNIKFINVKRLFQKYKHQQKYKIKNKNLVKVTKNTHLNLSYMKRVYIVLACLKIYWILKKVG